MRSQACGGGLPRASAIMMVMPMFLKSKVELGMSIPNRIERQSHMRFPAQVRLEDYGAKACWLGCQPRFGVAVAFINGETSTPFDDRKDHELL